MESGIAGIDIDQITPQESSEYVESDAVISDPVEAPPQETLEEVKRREETYKGLVKDLRAKERKLTEQVEQQSKQVRDLLSRFSQLEGNRAEQDFERSMQEAARMGWTAEEQNRARALFRKEQQLKAQEETLAAQRPMVDEARADIERNNYIRSAITRANALLQRRNVQKTISWDELTSRFEKPPQSMAEVDSELQELIAEAALTTRGNQQKATLQQRAKDGIDRTESGSAGTGSFASIEALFANKRISRADFMKARATALANGEISY